MAEGSTAIVKFTPISGCREEGNPECYLLEIDQAKILLDVGSTSMFNTDYLQTLKKLTKTLDLILISHGDMQHCGGLSQLYSSLTDLNCPILATVPVHHLGLVTLYDAFESHFQATGVAPPGVTLDDIDNVFEKMTILRYNQSYTCNYNNAIGIQVTPIPAGHSLGGSIWRIRKHGEEIFYAMNFNHKREAHLDGAAFDQVERPSLLIADAKGALDVHIARKQRDSELIDAMISSLKAGGTVLLPTDTASRSLELLQVIEMLWTASKYTYPVFFLSFQSQRVIDLVKGMLEWMSQSLTKVFEQNRTNPFDLKNIKLVHSIEEISAVPGPKVVLATMECLECGMSRRYLIEILNNPSSAVIMTSKFGKNSLASNLMSIAKGTSLNISYAERIPLEGEELHRYRLEQRETAERIAAEEAYARLQLEREEEEEDEGEESMELDNEQMSSRRIEQEQINNAISLQHYYWTDYKTDWFVDNHSIPFKNANDTFNSPYYPMIPPNMSIDNNGIPVRYQSFPVKEIRRSTDDYGESLDVSEFTTLNTFSSVEALVPSPSMVPSLSSINNLKADSSAPLKWIVEIKDITVKCNRKFIDFSGISDGRSVKTIYARIQPKRLLLIGGSSEATEYLFNYFMHGQTSRTMEVYAPNTFETVIVSSAINVMQANLTETLIAQLRLQICGDYEVAMIRGEVQSLQIDSMENDEDETTSTSTGNENRLISLTSPSEDLPRLSPIFLGDPRLGEIRKLVHNELKIPAVFISGDLVCGNGERRVLIKKDPQGNGFIVEGPICEEYYNVRRLLYSTLAFLQ